MKKYNKPELLIIEIEEQVAIATSTVYNFGFDGEKYDTPTNADIWNWN